MEYTWLIFGLLSAFMAGLVALFGKMGLQGVDSSTATAIRAVIMALFLAVIIVFEGKLKQIPDILANSNAMMFIVLSGIAGALSWLFYFMALKIGRVSQVAPIDRLSVVFAIILAAIFLGEKVSPKAAVGVVLVAAGAIVIALA